MPGGTHPSKKWEKNVNKANKYNTWSYEWRQILWWEIKKEGGIENLGCGGSYILDIVDK